MPARSRRPDGAPTLAAIAREVGVTVPTVSKVLNGRSDVSQATRERVSLQLQQAGYPLEPEHERMSRHHASQQVGLIDLVVPGVQGSWVTSMMSGVEEVVSGAGQDLVVTVAREQPGTSWVDRLIARGSRGAVLALVTPTIEEHRRLVKANVVVVSLDPGADPNAGIPTVGATNWQGGYSATEHLLGLGHRRIGLIGGLIQHRYSRARVDGYRSALAMERVEFDPGLVRHADWSKRGAAVATADLLALREPPTAIFACSDRMALGVYEYLTRTGRRIPQDLSVVGFDDLPEARWLTPALTTVRQPVGEMGATAARILLRLMEAHGDPIERHELSTQLIVRASAARLPGS